MKQKNVEFYYCKKKIQNALQYLFLPSDDVHRIPVQQSEEQIWSSFNGQGLRFVKQVSDIEGSWLVADSIW